MLSVSSADAASSVRSLAEELQRSRKRIDELEAKLLDHEAAEMQLKSGMVVETFKGRGIETLKLLAAKVCARPGVVALLADESDQLRVVFARSADRTEDMAALLRKVIERFGGRGGGRPNVAQAGGLQGSAAEVLDFAKAL
jgi:alanyl-tRNA synthetase